MVTHKSYEIKQCCMIMKIIFKTPRFVLLKERNMLLTMEEIYKRQWKYFPNPERIDKVEDSMANLESVVRERNKAYYMLETGTNGERPVVTKYNPLGKMFLYIYSI